jgi:hypothetical protein
VDIQSIATGMSALKTATDIAQSLLKGSNAGSADKEKLMQLQSSLISIQQEILIANAQNISLSEQLRQLNDKDQDTSSWLQTRNKYKLTEYGKPTYAYELKPQFHSDEPNHKICPRCFQLKTLSVLQFRSVSEGREWYDCLKCKSQIKLGNYVQDSIGFGVSVARSNFNVFDI